MNKEELLEKLKSDPIFFMEKSLVIIDKATNQHIPFKLNKIQRFYWDNHSKFDYIIKSRKGGISTFNIARFIHKCNFESNQKAIMLCQNEDATTKMFKERVLSMIENSIFKLNVKINLSEGVVTFLDTGSTFYVGTAGSKTFGRGSDITLFHMSEYAHWDNTVVLTGVEEALMDEAEGVIETTANGINFAHKLWKRSVAKLTRYKAVFIPWFFDNSYRIKGVTGLTTLSKEESDLVKTFDLGYEQLAWRRKKLKDMSEPEYFPQEYPATPEEAFISSGTMVFEWTSLLHHEKFCMSPRFVGHLRDADATIKFIPQSNGNLSIWNMPMQGHKYVIGADIAEGVKNGAYSTAEIIDVNTMEQVAEYCGHVTPTDYGNILDELGRFYNNALLVPEAWPGCGGVTIDKLIALQYPNLYKRNKGLYSHKKDDQLWGWETTRRTRPLAIHAIAEALREFRIKIKSDNLIDELRSFVYNGEYMEPEIGCFSDRVIALALAWAIIKEYNYEAMDGKVNFMQQNMRRETSITHSKYKGKRYGVR